MVRGAYGPGGTIWFVGRDALELTTSPRATLAASEPLKFQPTWESLKQFRCPEWFPDAKFGIWAHWGPQCVPTQGDWYARNMYQVRIQGHHPALESRGARDAHPPLQESRREVFRRARSHCDNFDCWNSRHHRWRKIARQEGLRFGVTEHMAWSYSWFNVNKLAPVPYAGRAPSVKR